MLQSHEPQAPQDAIRWTQLGGRTPPHELRLVRAGRDAPARVVFGHGQSSSGRALPWTSVLLISTPSSGWPSLGPPSLLGHRPWWPLVEGGPFFAPIKYTQLLSRSPPCSNLSSHKSPEVLFEDSWVTSYSSSDEAS